MSVGRNPYYILIAVFQHTEHSAIYLGTLYGVSLINVCGLRTQTHYTVGIERDKEVLSIANDVRHVASAANLALEVHNLVECAVEYVVYKQGAVCINQICHLAIHRRVCQPSNLWGVRLLCEVWLVSCVIVCYLVAVDTSCRKYCQHIVLIPREAVTDVVWQVDKVLRGLEYTLLSIVVVPFVVRC